MKNGNIKRVFMLSQYASLYFKIVQIECKDRNLLSYFLSWPCFISSVGRVLFPQLAVFHFPSWLCFVSSVGCISLPQLAETLSKETIFAWKNHCKLHKTDTPPTVVLCFENCQTTIIGKYNKNYRKWASSVPMWGKQLSHLGQAACPKWATFALQTVPKTLHWTDSNPLF